jgi:hypothetical protein
MNQIPLKTEEIAVRVIAESLGIEVQIVQNSASLQWIVTKENGKPLISWKPAPDWMHDIDAVQTALTAQDKAFNIRFATALENLALKEDLMVHQLTAKQWAGTLVGMLAPTMIVPVALTPEVKKSLNAELRKELA